MHQRQLTQQEKKLLQQARAAEAASGAEQALALFRKATVNIDMSEKPKLREKIAKLEAEVEGAKCAPSLTVMAGDVAPKLQGAKHPAVVRHLHSITHREHPEAEEDALFELAQEVLDNTEARHDLANHFRETDDEESM